MVFQEADDIGGGVLEPGTSFPPTNRGLASRKRGDDWVRSSIQTSGLPSGTYTVWWVIFNDPDILWEQTHTLLGGCFENANVLDRGEPFCVQCFDPQAVDHLPRRATPVAGAAAMLPGWRNRAAGRPQPAPATVGHGPQRTKGDAMPQAPVITDQQAFTERYRAAVQAGDLDALAKLYHPDVLLDAHVPNWRFQVQGRHAVAETTGTGLPGPGWFTSFDAEPTASGDLLVRFEWRQDDPQGGQVSRELHIWRLDDGGRIVEQVVFCAGIWDQQLQAQMADEAPLIRP